MIQPQFGPVDPSSGTMFLCSINHQIQSWTALKQHQICHSISIFEGMQPHGQVNMDTVYDPALR